jgi:chromosome segregation ATPase
MSDRLPTSNELREQSHADLTAKLAKLAESNQDRNALHNALNQIENERDKLRAEVAAIREWSSLPQEVTNLRAKLAQAERERDAARKTINAQEVEIVRLQCQVNCFYLGTADERLLAMTKERDGLSRGILAMSAANDELRAEVARLKEDRLKGQNDYCALREIADAEIVARESAEALLMALREAVEEAPCHDFCRWQQAQHQIPYGTHHPACWKVAALAKSADAPAPIDPPAAT